MLTEADFRLLEKEAINLYADLELEIIQEIAERIANVGYMNTVAYNNAVILQEMGMLYEDIINEVAKYNETSVSQIKDIFETAGVRSIKRDDTIYKLAGLNPKGLNSSMQQLLESTVRNTHYNLSRLTQTTAATSQMQFINGMNKAYMEVSTGVKSYSQSILDTVKYISSQGGQVEYPSGYKMSIEAATRMNILTSVNQASGQLQLMRAEEMEWDFMELSAHSGARPEHAEWQGKIVSRSGQPGYLTLDDIGYGEITGFQGINCRHTWFPYYKDSTKTYTNTELQKLKNEKVEYNGQKISKYEATQIQRRMERQIRNDKKILSGYEGILKSNTTDNKLIVDTKTDFARRTLIYKTHQNELEDLITKIDSKIDDGRLFANKYSKDVKTQVSNVSKIANKYNNSDIIGITIYGPETTKVMAISEHIISRTYGRELNFENVEDTLKNPLDYGTIKTDKEGRRSFSVIGEKVTLYINPDTGKITTSHATSTKLVNKLKEKKNENNK